MTGDAALAELATVGSFAPGVEFEHAAIGMCILDLDGRYVHVNPAFAAFLGRPVEEIVGLPSSHFCHPDDHAASKTVREALVEGRVTEARNEKRFLLPDGSIRYVLRHARAVTDDAGRPAYIFAQYVDVSDYRREQEAREAERERLAALLRFGDLLQLAADDHDELIASGVRGAADVLGAHTAIWLDDGSGRYRLRAVDHPDPDVVAAVTADDAAGDGDHGMLSRIIINGQTTRMRADADDERFSADQRRWIRAFGLGHVLAVPLGARGRVLGALLAVRVQGETAFSVDDERLGQEVGRRLAVALDNSNLRERAEQETDRRRLVEEELRRSEEYHRAIVQQASDVLVIVGADGMLTYVSPAMVEVLGRPTDVTGRTVLDDVHPDDVAAVSAEFARMLAGARTGAIRARVLHGDGTWRDIDARATNMLDHPVVAGIIVSVRDITEQQEISRQLQTRATEQAVVARIGEFALTTTNLGALIEEAARLMMGTLRVDALSALEVEDGGLVVRAALGWPEDLTAFRLPIDDSTPAGRSVLTGLAMTVSDIPAEMDPPHPVLERAGMTSVLTVLVGKPQAPLGVIAVFSKEKRHFADHERVFLQGVANVVGAAMERQRADARVRHQALHDSLTGLPNRRLLLRRIGHGIEAATQDGRLLGVLLLDLDNFKDVNDSLGHEYGDRLLVEVTERLAGAVRGADTVARLGGDEFAICLPGLRTPDDAVTVARKLLRSLDEPFRLGGLDVSVGGSIGVAVAPDHGVDASALMQRADVAMYRAKRTGAGWTVFEPELDAAHTQRLASLADLRQAIDAGAFTLHYQPIVQLDTGRVDRVEALVRWVHPERGVVPPAEFIPLAEQSRMIPRLTAWVLEAAAAQCAAWRAQGRMLQVSINVSGTDLDDTELPQRVAAAAERHGLPLDALMVEITESEIVDPDGRQAVSRLAELGIPLAIDDFGTGYSSLAYLKLLPVSEVKIDRAFVMRMRNDARDVAIVRSVVELATTLGLDVVAEGVEDLDTAALLRGLGVRWAQGYHFSRPMPAAELELPAPG